MKSIASRRVAKVLAGVSFVAMISTATPALAQAAPADDDAAAADGEILVIGNTKQLQNTMVVPTSITAFSGEQLETKSVSKVADIATFTPGFTIVPAPGNNTAITLAIRGQVQNDILATLEPSVGTYVDDVYWGRAYGLNAGLLDISNVQVLKGPQGTLFGRNTTGGALVITSNDPNTRELSGRIAMTYGRYNELSGEGAVNVPIGNNIALRGAIKIGSRDGWAYGTRLVDPAGNINNTAAATNVVVPNGQRYNDKNEVQGRVKLLVEFSPSTKLVLSGEWYDYNSDGPARQLIYKVQSNVAGSAGDQVILNSGVNKYVPYYAANPNAVGVDAFDCSYATNQTLNCSGSIVRRRAPYTYANTSTYSAKFTTDLSFGTFKLIGATRKVYTDNFIDLDGSSSLIHATSLTQDLKQWSVEAQLAGDAMGGNFKYVIGATYFHEDGYDLSYSLTGATNNAPGRATRNFGFIDNDSVGVYGQINWHLNDVIAFTGGLRYSDDKKVLDLRSANANLNGQLQGLAGNLYPTGYVAGGLFDPCNAAGAGIITGANPATDCSVTKSAKFNAVSWTGGIDITPTDHTLIYAKVSKGYRSGGHNLRAFNDAQFTPFLPETVIEEEVGLKASLADNRVRLTLAGYHNQISNAQRTTIVTTGAVSNTLVGNAATVRNYGLEGDLVIRPVTGFTLTASGSVNKAKYLAYSDATGDRTGERFVLLPEKKFALGAQYEANLSSALSATFNVDYSWTSSFSGNECTLANCWTGAADANGLTAAQVSAQVFAATELPSAGILNARVTFALHDKYKLAFWGRNLTDDRGYVQALRLIAPSRNYVSGLRRDPATYGVTASVEF
ncbi:TonB-dependent receptor [Novosphingobium sp.]|uniref:TonB-dependent receptor n=1 Tax=Novosphingobium sp. TaxID=1874826 RepID=UPI0025FA752B|nr:TonB-dependent receptor [Novosphingobium sp.]